MSIYLEPAIFMCIVLNAHPELDEIDFKTLRKIVDHVTEKLINHNVIIEWTRDAVQDALHTYHQTFTSRSGMYGSVGLRKPHKYMPTDVSFSFGFSDDFLEELRQAILEIEIDPTDTKTVFVSGHLDLTEEEFTLNYSNQISIAHNLGHNIIVGDANGCDEMAQRFINTLAKSRSKTFVYYMFQKPRNNPCEYRSFGGFNSDNERDTEMTKASNYDIAWVRPGREKSGTAKNLARRKSTKMRVLTPDDRISDLQPRSIFLAGPTPRSSDVKSWRPEALDYLRRTGFDGDVLVPERKDFKAQFGYCDQVEWELMGLERCSVVLFWVPRDMVTMPALTTNVEFGMYIKSNKIVYGRPQTAANIRYLDVLYQKWQGIPCKTLEQTLDVADKLTNKNE
jgi:hypothetical protein